MMKPFTCPHALTAAKPDWLPFNKGHHHGAGNAPNPEGYRSDYLWRDILSKDSWLEIIGRFIHLQVEEFDV